MMNRRTMNRSLPAALVLAICSLAGCYAPHVYGERGTDIWGRKSGYGYSDIKLDETTWEVSYMMGTKEDADIRLLYRCAEIADSNGYDYFITANQISTQTSDIKTVNQGRPGWATDPPRTTVTSTSDFISSVRIKLFKGTKPENDPNALNAREVLKNVGPKIGKG
jgi:hypothetical protein